MKPTSVEVQSPSDDDARREGAEKLGVGPDEVTVEPTGESTYTVTLNNAPGQFDLAVTKDRMSVVIKTITPPIGDGTAVTVEDVEKALAGQNVTFGMKKDAIERVVAQVVDTGKPKNNVIVAVGEPVMPGFSATIDVKVGTGAANKDPRAANIVKAGQAVAIKNPATKGTNGRNVRGEEVIAESGLDRDFAAGDNVALADDGSTFVALDYGEAKVDANSASVKSLVEVSDDAMSVQMTIFPTVSDNTALTRDDVLGALEDAGVVCGIKDEVIAAALKESEPTMNVVVAKALPAKHGVDAGIEFKFLLNGKSPEIVDAERKDKQLDETPIVKETVTAGDVLAVKTPAQPAEEGRTVTGNVLPGKEPTDASLAARPDVAVLDDGLTYVVADGITGYANFIDGQLCVEHPIRVSDDKLTASLCLQPPSASGKMLTMDLVKELVDAHAITHGIDLAPAEKALKQVPTMTEPLRDLIIAKGTAPENGEDARISFEFQASKIVGRSIEGTDRVDYKERATIQNVKEGDLLATKIPATSGNDGVDVFGTIKAAEPGKDKTLTSAGNVSISDDGLEYTAEIDGMVTLIGDDKIGVFKQYDISGDVDYSTGNLTMDGTLNIQGWIRSGFVVRASGDISVGKGIEDATVEAGGNLELRGGIVGKEEGKVSVTGDIQAHFIENAQVYAGGNIVVRDAIMRSSVSTKGSVAVTAGKGRVLGGSVMAAKRVEAKQLGSRAGVHTLVDVGTDAKAHELALISEKRLAFLRRYKAKIDLSLARIAQKRGKGGLTNSEEHTFAKLVKLKRETALEEAKMAKYRRRLAKCAADADAEPPVVKVTQAVHAGTTIVVKGHTRLVDDDIERGGTFTLNMEKRTVEYLS